MEMMDEASEEANLILSSVDLITIKKWLSPGKVVLFELEQFGFASALETLCGQAYGAEQYQKIGTYTYPAMFFCIAICIPISVYSWTNTRVANELGAGNPEPARLSTCVVIFLAVAEAAIGSVALFCYRNVLAYLFNTDKDVVNYVSELVPLLSTAIFMDSMQSVLSGSTVAIALAIVTSLTNWEKQATLARERILEGASSTDNRSARVQLQWRNFGVFIKDCAWPGSKAVVAYLLKWIAFVSHNESQFQWLTHMNMALSFKP
ncbi:hypothetical protein WN943_005231 [Citrus x changshan-huyou]